MAFQRCLIAGVGAVLASAASAADLPLLAQDPGPSSAGSWSWLSNVYVHLGPAALIVDASAKIYTAAGRYPGASIRIPPQVTAAAEVGYRFTPNWAVSVTVGVPPTATIDAAGSVAPLGKLGSNYYGPITVTGHYHFTNFGRFQPYVGLGPTYAISFASYDAALTDLRVRGAWGAVAQAGADYMLTDRLGLFVDFKKAYLRTKASGALGPVRISSDVVLDPYVVSGGLTYRF